MSAPDKLQKYVRTAVKFDVVDAAQAEAWKDGVRELAERDEYFFCVNRFLITATR